MRVKFFLIIVILQLFLIQSHAEPEFGDIISFAHGAQNLPLYMHFAVYVGNEHLNGKADNQDIFEMVRKSNEGRGGCRFGSINGRIYKINNYFDEQYKQEHPNQNHRPKDEMIRDMERLNNNCGDYGLVRNNCEHVATEIRYGRRQCKQPGSLASMFLSNM